MIKKRSEELIRALKWGAGELTIDTLQKMIEENEEVARKQEEEGKREKFDEIQLIEYYYPGRAESRRVTAKEEGGVWSFTCSDDSPGVCPFNKDDQEKVGQLMGTALTVAGLQNGFSNEVRLELGKRRPLMNQEGVLLNAPPKGVLLNPQPDGNAPVVPTFQWPGSIWVVKPPVKIIKKVLEQCVASAEIGQKKYEESLIPP
jgi:hypothetical protein